MYARARGSPMEAPAVGFRDSYKATDKDLQLNINYYYTSFGQVKQHKAISIATTLADKAFSHLVITIDNTVPPITD